MYQTRYQEQAADELESFIEDMPVHLKIDGMEYEVTNDHSDQSDCEVNLEITLGLKRMIQRHPEEYIDELHYFLFTEAEITNLLMKGAA